MHLKQAALISTICIVWSLVVADEDFVNPTDLLNFDPVNIRMRNKADKHEKTEPIPRPEHNINTKSSSANQDLKPNNNNNKISKKGVDGNNPCSKPENHAVESVFKRHIMSLVQLIESRIDSSNVPVEFCMKMKASYIDLLLFKHYGTGNTNNIHQVYEKLERIILYATDLPNHSPIYWLEMKLGLSSPVLLMFTAIILLGIITARILINVRISKSFFVKGIVLAFLFSVITTYIELYQQKVAQQEKILTDHLTERCPQLSDSIWSRFTGYITSSVTFQDENCREYYEALVVNPIFKVSVLEAGAMAVVKTVVAPMKIIGNGMKEFITGLFKDLPLQFAYFILTIMLMLFIICPFLMSGYTVRIPFLLTLQAPQRQQIEYISNDVKSLTDKQRVQKLIDGISQLSLQGDAKVKRPINPADSTNVPPIQQSVLECKLESSTEMAKISCHNKHQAVNKGSREHSEPCSYSQESYRTESLTSQNINQDSTREDPVLDSKSERTGFEGDNQHKDCKDDSIQSNSDFFLAQEERTVDKNSDSDTLSQTETANIDNSNNCESKGTTDCKGLELVKESG